MALTEKQKNCPYCHERADHYAEPIVGDFNDIGCGLVHGTAGWYLSSWDYDVCQTTDKPVAACSICRRDLRGETDE